MNTNAVTSENNPLIIFMKAPITTPRTAGLYNNYKFIDFNILNVRFSRLLAYTNIFELFIQLL